MHKAPSMKGEWNEKVRVSPPDLPAGILCYSATVNTDCRCAPANIHFNHPHSHFNQYIHTDDHASSIGHG
jgi:hypothetical protein